MKQLKRQKRRTTNLEKSFDHNSSTKMIKTKMTIRTRKTITTNSDDDADADDDDEHEEEDIVVDDDDDDDVAGNDGRKARRWFRWE